MTTASFSPGQVSTSPSTWLWAAIAALAATTVALGASLWQTHTRSAEPVAPQSLVAESQTGAASTVPAAASGTTAPAPQATAAKAADPVGNTGSVSKSKQAQTPVQHPQVTTKKIANSSPPAQTVLSPDVVSVAPSVEATATPDPTASSPWPVVRAVCATCGTVEGVTPVQQPGASSGVGAVAGAALGGLVGNQVGGGTGKTIATLLGVVGGSIAGDAVEKRMKHETRYRILVRMEDGSVRTLEQATPATVGARVTVDGDSMQAAR